MAEKKEAKETDGNDLFEIFGGIINVLYTLGISGYTLIAILIGLSDELSLMLILVVIPLLVVGYLAALWFAWLKRYKVFYFILLALAPLLVVIGFVVFFVWMLNSPYLV